MEHDAVADSAHTIAGNNEVVAALCPSCSLCCNGVLHRWTRVFPGEEAMDPQTGMPLTEVPGWMPREGVDNVTVHKAVFSDWFKTDEWDTLPPEAKEASLIYFSALSDIEMRQAQRAQELQAEEGMNQGMMNAAKPDVGTPQSSLPAIPS